VRIIAWIARLAFDTAVLLARSVATTIAAPAPAV
jgi:hypothetical protein